MTGTVLAPAAGLGEKRIQVNVPGIPRNSDLLFFSICNQRKILHCLESGGDRRSDTAGGEGGFVEAQWVEKRSEFCYILIMKRGRNFSMTLSLMPEDYGKPALKVAGLEIWIHGRQFPDAEDYWDGNWLHVTAHCEAPGASIVAQGSFLMVSDIASFGRECEAMHGEGAKTAELKPLEEQLSVSLQVSDGLGHISVVVEITPDYYTQTHKFKFELDQSYLPIFMSQCAAIVRDYPIRGKK